MVWKALNRVFALVLLLGVLLAGCSPEQIVVQTATADQSPETAHGPAAVPNDTGWRQVDGAMELRSVRLEVEGRQTELTILRFDPKAYRVRVKYDIANAGSIRQWYDALQPLAIINGGYFDRDYKPTALVVFDGIRRGASYEGFGGMVVINEHGEFELRSLREQAFNPDENLQQAMQSAPMLIQPGGVVSDLAPDADRSRRSVIARDRQGRILLIVSDSPALTLSDLAQLLKHSDLELDAALNLDGGRSTGMYVETDTAEVRIDSFDRLPLVLVVERQ